MFGNFLDNSPLVSVILPVFNGDCFLSGAIESVLGQSYPHWELLIVDDGSTDKSSFICDNYSGRDPRISVFHQTNGGVNSARAVGTSHADGEYLVFLDADDKLVPDALEYLVNNCTPDTDLLLAEGRSEAILGKEDYLVELWAGRIGPALWGKMFRTAVYKQIEYKALDRRLVMGEDLLLNSMFALVMEKARLLPRRFYSVNRDNAKSVTRTFKHNWDYEKFYFGKVEELFLGKCQDMSSYERIRLLVNKSWLNAMKYVMLDGGNINYGDADFKTIQSFFRDRKKDLGPSERMIFYLKNASLYRIVMRTCTRVNKEHLFK